MMLRQSSNQSKCSTTTVPILEASEQNVKSVENVEILSILRDRDQQRSPTGSLMIQSSAKLSKKSTLQSTVKLSCLCGQESATDILKNELVVEEIEKLLKEREYQLRSEYDRLLEKEIETEKQRFELILQNEQMRTSYMLREAHRERQEKIKALEKQLECKNIAALMYVMCTERSRGKLEKLELIEEYTTYIQALQELLIEGQQLILHLSRGYKTAARVDREWRLKMTKVIGEFMNFIYHFAGGPPENNQYYLDLPKLLKTEAPIEDNPLEDPCEEEVLEEEEGSANFGEKNWWETLEGENRPFILFGDMSEFQPPQRREVLKSVKAPKTAPKAWKQYNFNNLCIKSQCENADDIKDIVYLNNMPNFTNMNVPDAVDSPELINDIRGFSKLSFASRRQTAISIDIRNGSMGSLLRLITSANVQSQPPDKAALLGAKDSIEVLSTTRLRQSIAAKNERPDTVPEGVKIPIGKRRVSCFDDLLEEISAETNEATSHTSFSTHVAAEGQGEEDEMHEQEKSIEDLTNLRLGSHTNSLEVISTHVPEKDHKINYEKVCPMDVCQRLKVDSFMRSLPSYMTANPFTHIVQTYEGYETCTKEQLDILRERIEARKALDTLQESELSEHVLKEWETGIATQTSIQSFDELCSCFAPCSTPVDNNYMFDLRDLIPIKQLMDAINKACLHDERIEFNRFKLVGQEEEPTKQAVPEKEFMGARVRGITNILKHHPSLLDIFQANAR